MKERQGLREQLYVTSLVTRQRGSHQFVTVRYRERGAGKVIRCPACELSGVLERLAKRSLDAIAEDDAGNIVGQTWNNDGRRVWSCDAFGGAAS